MIRATLRRIRRLTRCPLPPRWLRDDPRYKDHEIGEYSYGKLTVWNWDHASKLRIGRFCSFAEGVQILLGGEHRLDWGTTYPFPTLFVEAGGFLGHPATKGDVNIGNDVWIGQEAMVLSGVTLGNGAAIGARALVTKTVAPYAIVAGNPARVVRYRFPPEQIEALLRIAWWDWPMERIREAWPLLLSKDIGAFIAKYEPEVRA